MNYKSSLFLVLTFIITSCGGGGGGGGSSTPTPPTPPGPKPTPSYTYGNPCAHPDDGDCGNNCPAANCDFSWPTNDPAKWNSKDAACRCKPSTEEQFIY